MNFRKTIKSRIIPYTMALCMLIQGVVITNTSIVNAEGNDALYPSKVSSLTDVGAGGQYVLTGNDGTSEKALSVGLGGVTQETFSAEEAVQSQNMIWNVESFGTGYSFQSEAKSTKTSLSVANISVKGTCTVEDVEGEGLKVSNGSWINRGALYTLAGPISFADIDNITIRYKVLSGAPAVYINNNNNNYTNLSSGSASCIQSFVDMEGFTISTFDFEQLMGTNYSETGTLSSILFGTANTSDSVIYDYVMLNEIPENETIPQGEIALQAANVTKKGDCVVEDVEGEGLRVAQGSWSNRGATFVFGTAISYSDIENITFRYKVETGTPVVYFNGSIYTNLSSVPASCIQTYEDTEGFTVKTYNFEQLLGDNYSETGTLSSILFGTANTSDSVIYDYIMLNEIPEIETILQGEIALKAANVTKKGDCVVEDVEGEGLKVSNGSWINRGALYTLAGPISFADIENITIRYKVLSGAPAVYINNSNDNYTSLSSGSASCIQSYVDIEGFTIVTFDFQQLMGDNYSETGTLSSILFGTANPGDSVIYNYVMLNEIPEIETVPQGEIALKAANVTKKGECVVEDVEGEGLRVAQGSWNNRGATFVFGTAISYSDIENITFRYKVESGTPVVYFNGSIYTNLSSVPESCIQSYVDIEGFTIKTYNFAQLLGDNYSETGTLSSILFGTANTTDSAIYDYIMLNEIPEIGTVPQGEIAFKAANVTSRGACNFEDVEGEGLKVSNCTYFGIGAYYTLGAGIERANVETITFRFKGDTAVVYFQNSTLQDWQEGLYVNLNSTDALQRFKDAEGYTIVTFDFQALTSGWPEDSKFTKILLSATNQAASVIYDYIMFGKVENEEIDQDDKNYLNIILDDSGNPCLTLGTKQSLSLTFDEEGNAQISAVIDGNTYYVAYDGSWKVTTGDSGINLNAYHLLKTLPDVEEEREEPLYTIVGFTDMHVDYGMHLDESSVIREKTQEALDAIKEKENPNIVLIGGDTISGNSRLSPWYHTMPWEKEKYDMVVEKVGETFAGVTESGNVLYVNGNHDHQVGTTKYNSGNLIDTIMTDHMGAFAEDDALYETITLEDGSQDTGLLAYYYAEEYTVGEKTDQIHFIGISTPYDGNVDGSNVGYTAESVQWVANKLESIGKDQTVIVFGHYPFGDSNGLTNDHYGIQGDANTTLKEVLSQYPNVLYLYGHDHGAEAAYIQSDTYERVTVYNSDGTKVNTRVDSSDGFKSCFMGSLSYYKNQYTQTNSGWLSDEQPAIVQALMVYVYEDRIELQMKNYGEKTGERQNLFTYAFDREFFIESDVYEINDAEGYVTGIAHRTSIEDFLNGFKNKEELEIFGVDGNKITDTSRFVRSQMVLKRNLNGKYVSQLEIRVNKAAVSDLAYTVEAVGLQDASGNVTYMMEDGGSIATVQILSNKEEAENAIVYVGLYNEQSEMLDYAYTDVNGSGTYEINLQLADLPEGATYRVAVYDSFENFTPISYLVTSDNERYEMDTVPNSAETEMVAGVDQRNRRIVVYKQSSDDWNNKESVVWEWKPSAALGYTGLDKISGPADAKLRYSDFYGGYVMVVTSGGGFLAIVDYETGECLYSDVCAASNPHAIELLPDGNVVVASSAGKAVTIYAASQGNCGGYYKEYELGDAHGLVWDPDYNLLWAFGNQLVAYDVVGTLEDPELQVKEDMVYTPPTPGPHDLYPVYGEPNKLWITTNDVTYQFDKLTGEFTTEYDGYSSISVYAIKSIGNQPYTGTVIRTVPDGLCTDSWNTTTIDLFVPNGDGTYTLETHTQANDAYYKARAWCYKYK